MLLLFVKVTIVLLLFNAAAAAVVVVTRTLCVLCVVSFITYEWWTMCLMCDCLYKLLSCTFK